jgi:hypothetical protein
MNGSKLIAVTRDDRWVQLAVGRWTVTIVISTHKAGRP